MKWIFTLLSLIIFYGGASAQLHQIMNAAGGSAVIGTDHHDFNIGEMVLVDTYQAGQSLLTQGFLQGNATKEAPGNTGAVVAENNFITPNADGKNDVLVFRGLEAYTQNRLLIFDRSGRKILTLPGYSNDWNGTVGGRMLHQDTYYYSLELGTGGRIRGFVTILHQP